MKISIFLLLLINNVFAAEFELNIIPEKLQNNNKLSNFIVHYGKPVSHFKNLYEFKSNNTNVIAYADEMKNVYRAEFRYYKSKISYEKLKKALVKFEKIKTKGHASGRTFSYKSNNETILFNNNSKQNLNSYEVKWKN